MGLDKLLLDHVGLPLVVILTDHLVISCAGWVKGIILRQVPSPKLPMSNPSNLLGERHLLKSASHPQVRILLFCLSI